MSSQPPRRDRSEPSWASDTCGTAMKSSSSGSRAGRLATRPVGPGRARRAQPRREQQFTQPKPGRASEPPAHYGEARPKAGVEAEGRHRRGDGLPEGGPSPDARSRAPTRTRGACSLGGADSASRRRRDHAERDRMEAKQHSSRGRNRTCVVPAFKVRSPLPAEQPGKVTHQRRSPTAHILSSTW